MSYLGHTPRYNGRARGMGGASSCGCGGGLGATASTPPSGVTATITGDPVAALIQQVNRFGPQAPPAYAIVAAPFPLATGTVTPDVATAAVLIVQRAALDPVMTGTGSVASVVAASAGLADPVAYVNANLPAVVSTIQLYGDSVGLPSATPGIIDTLTSPMGLIAIGAFALYLLMRKKR